MLVPEGILFVDWTLDMVKDIFLLLLGPVAFVIGRWIVKSGKKAWHRGSVIMGDRFDTLVALGEANVLDIIKDIRRQIAPEGEPSIYETISQLKEEVREIRQLKKVSWAIHELQGVAFWTSDKAGQCIYASAAMCDIVGLPFNELRGVGWISNLHPEDKALVTAEWETAVRQERRFAIPYRFRHSNGTEIAVVANSMAIRDDMDGDKVYHVGVLRRVDTHLSSVVD